MSSLSYVTSECDCQLAMMTIGLRVDEGEVDPDWLMEAVPKRITRKQGRNLPKGEIDEEEKGERWQFVFFIIPVS